MDVENKNDFAVVEIRKDLLPGIYADKKILTISNEAGAIVLCKSVYQHARFKLLKSKMMEDIVKNCH